MLQPHLRCSFPTFHACLTPTCHSMSFSPQRHSVICLTRFRHLVRRPQNTACLDFRALITICVYKFIDVMICLISNSPSGLYSSWRKCLWLCFPTILFSVSVNSVVDINKYLQNDFMSIFRTGGSHFRKREKITEWRNVKNPRCGLFHLKFI